MFAILQKYEFSSKSQPTWLSRNLLLVVCDTAKVRVFKQITTVIYIRLSSNWLFAILQKYEFSSKSQQHCEHFVKVASCLRYCKSTSFQANHNEKIAFCIKNSVVCDTAKVRVFKQITTNCIAAASSGSCLRYCKSTSFQANHNNPPNPLSLTKLFAILQKYEFSSKSQRYALHRGLHAVVCDTAKVRVFKQITTPSIF